MDIACELSASEFRAIYLGFAMVQSGNAASKSELKPLAQPHILKILLHFLKILLSPTQQCQNGFSKPLQHD